MAYNPLNPNGQAAMANSQPIVIASNQTPVSVAGTVNIAGNPSISGTVNVGNLPTTQNVSGSVVAFQGTSPWLITGSVQATVNTGNSSVQLLTGSAVIGSVATYLQSSGGSVISIGQGSIATVIIGGSILTSSTANQSVSGTVGASIIGQLPAGTAPLGSIATLQGTNPWIVTGSVQAAVSGSVMAYQLAGSILATSATVSMSNSSVMLLNSANVIGSVTALQGTNPWITTFSNSSVVAFQLAGSVLATSVTVNTGNSSVMLLNGANVIGSVTALQGTTPWLISSVYGNISGSVVSSQGTNPWVIGSIVGTYAEDAGHTDADKGVFALGVRNDAVSSMTSAERDYGAHAIDAAGRTITVPFAGQQACIISYTGSVVSGSVTLIQASVIGSRNYITDYWVANTGSVANLITFQGGDTSVVGYTIAPATGGSNAVGIAVPLRTTLSQDLAFKASGTTISSIIYLTVKGYQAP